jgi:hypothetical protein
MQVHIFAFDEELISLRGLGPPIDLSPFYDPGVSITHTCFIHRGEEILFVDSSAQARIFSLITLLPKYSRPFYYTHILTLLTLVRRPSLRLPQVPRAIYSVPDGSGFLVSQEVDGGRTITAYFFFFFESICIPAYSSVNKPGRSYEPLHLRT